MPNWVYNNTTVKGERKDLIAFRDKASKLSPRGIENGSLDYNEDNAQVLSFWNFIEPEDKGRYFGASDYKPENYEELSMEEKFAHSMKHSSDGWYDWNVSNWGTKWDACDSSLDDHIESKEQYLYYSFSTAWSIPEPVFNAMVEQHPELSFEFYSEEEQGWGAEFESTKGSDGVPTLITTKEWDIPDSHAAYVDLGREDGCNCQDGDDDQEYWFEDCPRPEQVFAVVVEQTLYVKAANAEKAWELAGEKLAGVVMELGEGITQADENSIFVKDIETNQRLFPVA